MPALPGTTKTAGLVALLLPPRLFAILCASALRIRRLNAETPGMRRHRWTATRCSRMLSESGRGAVASRTMSAFGNRAPPFPVAALLTPLRDLLHCAAWERRRPHIAPAKDKLTLSFPGRRESCKGQTQVRFQPPRAGASHGAGTRHGVSRGRFEPIAGLNSQFVFCQKLCPNRNVRQFTRLMQIRIKSIPPGEAPEHIRQAWVGLVIPVPPRVVQRRSFLGFGVLSGPKSRMGALLALLFGRAERHTGYLVSSKVALDLLAARSPDAVDWWRKNAPRFFESGQGFIFSSDSCEEIL